MYGTIQSPGIIGVLYIALTARMKTEITRVTYYESFLYILIIFTALTQDFDENKLNPTMGTQSNRSVTLFLSLASRGGSFIAHNSVGNQVGKSVENNGIEAPSM
ncbi:hypothetical protein BJ875DRAFT_445256 [Amylocarpus encephaloides]|uniref:Uncharacterized protein n=1 Tax=Amylocarpus encephaloides TaxID=45428 RepID=A0A9P7YAM6_9HELO|nr:hypothetical protein BJ875DRAFT_445256 [Amylocarpus encephaloides]